MTLNHFHPAPHTLNHNCLLKIIQLLNGDSSDSIVQSGVSKQEMRESHLSKTGSFFNLVLPKYFNFPFEKLPRLSVTGENIAHSDLFLSGVIC